MSFVNTKKSRQLLKLTCWTLLNLLKDSHCFLSLKTRLIFSFNLCVCVCACTCVCSCMVCARMCAHVCTCTVVLIDAGASVGHKVLDAPGTGTEISGICEMPSVGAGNWTWILRESSMCSLTAEPSLRSLFSFYGAYFSQRGWAAHFACGAWKLTEGWS